MAFNSKITAMLSHRHNDSMIQNNFRYNSLFQNSKAYSKRICNFSSFCLCGLLLASCSVGPDYSKPGMPLAENWGDGQTSVVRKKGENKQDALAGWWYQLNDPLLNQLVSSAIADNLTLATAKARLRESRALVYQTSGALFPSLDASAGYKRQRSQNGPTNDAYNAGFDSAWEIDLFGANRRSLEAAQAGFNAAQEDLRDATVTLIGDVAANYVEARRLQEQLRLSKETATSQRRTANLIQQKYKSGAVSNLDASNAAGQAADMEATIPSLEEQLSISVHRIAVLLGKQPAAINNILDSKPAKTGNIPLAPRKLPKTVPADILLSRPDVRAAERRLAQATAVIGQREAQRYPSISLTGNIATNSMNLGDLGKSSTIGWAFGPSINLPLFRGGELSANVEIAKAQRDQNFIAYRSSVLTALEDVENALVSLKNNRLVESKKQEAAKSYQTSLTLSRKLYSSGNTDFLELLNAERSYYSAQQGALNARAAATTNYISLMKALGGGWNGTLNYQKPEVIDKNTGPHLKK